jgi:hypothetical protein
MSRGNSRIRTEAQWVAGGPLDVACEVGRTVITPVAKQIEEATGSAGVIEFYCAITTHLVSTMAIVLGPEVARKIAQTAMDQIDAAAAGAAELQRTGAH